ncbi:hypothetical protein [Demequina silvatica]|uniref:hypothetical protein n=1 Tax=Demequina silvatica TaxID=1638988 RepID=UPI000781B699|nr:hypothetical protein [Demequina silvatica]
MRVLAVLVAAAMVMAGCATGGDPGGSPAASVAPVEPTCAEVLEPVTGEAVAATEAPDVGAFDSAWLCVYALGEEWTLSDGPSPIADLDGVRALVDALEPADLMTPCTMELGPEYVLTLAAGEDLTRIVIDAYGCRWARVEGEQGLLSTPDGVIATLDSLAGL